MLSVTLTLTPEQQARLREGLDRRDPDTVRRVLLDAVEPTVDTFDFARYAPEGIVAVAPASEGRD